MQYYKIFFFIITWVCYKPSLSQSDIFEKNVCVTNTSFWLAGITDISTSIESRSMKVQKEEFANNSVKLLQSNFSNGPWKVYQGVKNDLVLDGRLEDFYIFTTLDKTGSNLYESLSSKTNPNQFQLPLSMQIRREAHILFCDGSVPFRSRCYWLSIGSDKNELRKCEKNKMLVYSNETLCSTVNITKNEGNNRLVLNFKRWINILIQKHNNSFLVELINIKNNRTIIDSTDKDCPITTTHAFIYSGKQQGLWKIHELNYIKTNEESNNTNLANLSTTAEGFGCISMHVKMCSSCEIALSLKDLNNNILENKTFNNKSSLQWSRIEIVVDSTKLNNTPIKLFVSTIGTSSDKFWIINNVRFCLKKVDQPGPPKNLKAVFDKNSNLLITWQYPNKSNRNVVAFDINIRANSANISCYKQLTIYRYDYLYNRTYGIKVHNSRLRLSTMYKVAVTAKSSIIGEEASVDVTAPPKKLLAPEDYNLFYTNTTITIATNLKTPEHTNEKYYLCLYATNMTNLNKSKLIFNCSITAFTIVSIEINNGSKDKSCSCIVESVQFEPEACYQFEVVLGIRYQHQTSVKNEWGYGEQYGSHTKFDYTAFLALPLFVAILMLIILTAVCRNKIVLKIDNCEKKSLSNNVLVQQKPTVLQNFKKFPNPPRKKPTTYSKPIKIFSFERYVKESVTNGELDRQHNLFPRGQTKPWRYASAYVNHSKNRCDNLFAYDYTRVILEKTNNDNSDYINANYINGHKTSKAYIATQRPTQATLNDFWRMIWQENVKYIAMIANSEEDKIEKAHQYWPDIGKTVVFGEIGVRHKSSEMFADYEARIFNVIHKEQTRELQQLHFFHWPDHGVPLHSQSLIPFLNRLLDVPVNSKSPMLVHCNDGFGRTGTLILADICVRMARREGFVDALGTLQKMRNHRPNMVEYVQQYKLAHILILECLFGLCTAIPCSKIEKEVQHQLNDGVGKQMLFLHRSQWLEEAIKTVNINEITMVVPEKNRFPHITPEVRGRVFLRCYPVTDKTSFYINAVKVDGFRAPGKFIVTQQPLPNTLGDFWRLVNENEVTVIISLNEVNICNKTSCIFWPTNISKKITPVDFITLTHLESTSYNYHSLTRLKLRNKKGSKQIFIISPIEWESHCACPKDIYQFLNFWKEADALSRRSKSVVVTCYDGATASGLYIAMSFIIEKMNLEQVCDVCQAVRAIRCNRPQFVGEKQQFEFLYKAAAAYISEFHSYANFN